MSVVCCVVSYVLCVVCLFVGVVGWLFVCVCLCGSLNVCLFARSIDSLFLCLFVCLCVCLLVCVFVLLLLLL